jgi:hypothetical protein
MTDDTDEVMILALTLMTIGGFLALGVIAFGVCRAVRRLRAMRRHPSGRRKARLVAPRQGGEGDE